MNRRLLRATTALTLTLSLLQPAHLPAQTLGEPLSELEELEAICAVDPGAEDCENLEQLREEAEAEAAAEADAEADVEAEQDAAAEPEAEAEVEAEAETEALVAPETLPDADEPTAADAVDELVEEPLEEATDEATEVPAEDVAEEPAEQDVVEDAAEEPAEETVVDELADPAAEDTAEEVMDEAADEETVAEEPAVEEPVEMEAEAEADVETDTAAETDAEAPVETDAAADTEAEVEADTAAEAEAETPIEDDAATTETEAAAEADAEAETAVGAEEPEPVTDEDRADSATLMEDPDVAAAAETLNQALAAQEEDAAAEGDDTAPLAGAGAAAALAAFMEGQDLAIEPTEVEEMELTEETTRTSGEEFQTQLTGEVQTTRSRDRGLSDLERAGLVALGGLAVGLIMSNGNRVVASSGDRVVVDRGAGNLAIWKDDDALLRQPGANQRIERYADGSTITRLDRADGTQIITIRDATGRVLRRARVEVDGSQTVLIDDTRRFEPVQVSQLPPPRTAEVRITEGTDPAMVRALLQAAEQPELGRSFSLRQVRETEPLRELAPEINANPILFPTGSSAVPADEAPKLLRLGRLMQDLIADNPREVFLIEGHTDAVGSAAFNLALSDRRAESVALALTEYFDVPPENMVVQGYGEEHLRVPTLEAEPANRRVAVRRVTWLLAER